MKRIGNTLVLIALFSVPSFAATWTAQNTLITTKAGATNFTTDIYKDAVKVETWTGPTQSNPNNVKAVIEARLAEWYNADVYDVTKLGTVTYVPPATPQAPTAADIARTKYAQDVLTYQGMLASVTLGIKLASDPAIVAQKALLISTFLPAYYPILAGLRF